MNARKVPPSVRARQILLKERGVWVYRSGKPTNVSIPELVARQRNERSQDLIEGRS